MLDTTGALAVPGAALHYQVRGTGPLLLISQSGEGDADRSTDLVGRLTDSYTVVTYDRRGLSRSHLAAPGCGATLAEHADDVQRLLASLTDTPALMLGCSLGAVIGMHVAVRYPGRIRTLIAHEPVAPRLLPDGERAHHERELAALQELYLREGLAAALPEIARTLGIDPASTDREPDLTPQPMNALRLANFDHFIRHDFTAVLHDTLDTTALKDTGTRIVPAVGRTTPHTVFDHRAATALAELLGREPRFLPGGHNGNTTHPRAYAAQLREILGSEDRQGQR
ncbi:putative hydrolase [Streptomyces scabiei 87.22]|uniref:Putative hydrolase n=1 Tax=Streptomyces scabiei (strain 87.22) TaxID=680198 RepID=C9YT19_STRSW|nr:MULTISPECIES: alpha/beta hydrolase [Streptomyces]MBP5870717.1 alpha/beta hydrolase [Streptomyces sp. LBUM 1485]MBP5913382.1 alpha/beta hydrolase [Streptomyces sp. LBUM 1486]MDX2576539.1 alpha/beta hydrolase [Streptomyces scabiei]MDX2652467.1 alpha/beta hydrolase [Streptomyces scabiei]MDX2721039.1 alpha/beta hydrolase [Streptomyces scabiei]